MVLLVDGLARHGAPWVDFVIPERIAKALIDDGNDVPLSALSNRDPLSFCADLVKKWDLPEGVVADALEDLELTWLLNYSGSPADGLRELLLHLAACGVPVRLASGISESVARRMALGSFPFLEKSSVFGRRELMKTAGVYETVVNRAASELSGPVRLIIANGLMRSVYWVGRLQMPENTEAMVLGGNENGSLLDIVSEFDLTIGERRNVEIRRRRNERADELFNRFTGNGDRGLSQEEIQELAGLVEKFTIGGNAEQFGYVDIAVGQENARALRSLRPSAMRAGHVLELISIDATLMEVELRNWLTLHRDASFSLDDRITFGQLVGRARSSGLNGSVCDRLTAFNHMRNDAIHHLARGSVAYADLARLYMSDCCLLFDLHDFVTASEVSLR